MTQPSLLLNLWRMAAVLFAIAAVFSRGTGQAQGLLSPVQGYVSVEPFELRKEFVMRFDTIAERVGSGDVTMIDVSNRAALEKAIGEWLEGKCPTEVDGKLVTMDLDRVHFVRPDPEKGLVVDDRESVSVSEALVGVVFATALDGPPQHVRVVWEVFPADGSEAVVEAGARGQRAARKLTPASPELIWENEMGLAVPELVGLPEVPETAAWWRAPWLPIFCWGLALVGLVIAIFVRKGGARNSVAILAVILGSAGLGLKLSPAPPISVTTEQADEISYALLRNIYHAFDYRRESDIYDVLAQSAEGDLLSQIYLEVQRSLQVENQGGARARVTDLDLRKCELAGSSDLGNAFIANCEWVAVGTVTHWGHTHDRVNRYRARLTIGPRDGNWRLLGLALESEERI